MDERQTKIVEGAGLEDSRINKEFIDLLQKWSTPVLLVILVVACGYAGLKYLERQRVRNLDAAFISFTEAELDQRPERMIEVASQNAGQGAVPAISRLNAADLYLRAYHLRSRPGTLGVAEEDQLDDAQAGEMLVKAGELYAEVFNKAKGAEGQELVALGGRWGMVAVALSQERYDAAEAGLNEIIPIAESQGFDTIVRDARALLASIPDLRTQREPVARTATPAAADTTPEPEAETPEGDAPADPSDG